MIETLTLVVALVGMVFSIIGGVSAFYNAFRIQRPWFKDYKNSKGMK